MYGFIYNIISNFVDSFEADTNLCLICKNWNGKRGTAEEKTVDYDCNFFESYEVFSSCEGFESIS